MLPWEYDGDQEEGTNRFKLDLTNVKVEMADGRYLKDGARATDILFGMWFLLPKHL